MPQASLLPRALREHEGRPGRQLTSSPHALRAPKATDPPRAFLIVRVLRAREKTNPPTRSLLHALREHSGGRPRPLTIPIPAAVRPTTNPVWQLATPSAVSTDAPLTPH